MNGEGIEFREGGASVEDIHAHLAACDMHYSPRLSFKVDIDRYSRKMSTNARTFEAWSGRVLVGLVAAYLNDRESRAGFITNVSVVREFVGRGIASVLLDRCLRKAGNEGMTKVRLEVGTQSDGAIHLYRNFGFSEIGRTNETVTMERAIVEERGHG
jgi:ribosomal protein S18 acetylase RimI-like enzyme